MSKAALVLAVAALLASATGCGEGSSPGAAGSSVAPAASQVFVSLDTSFDSSGWEAGRTLLEKLPDRDRAVAWLDRQLAAKGLDFEDDVKPALGPETDVVGLDATGQGRMVVLTQPDDAAKLAALVAKSDTPLVSREIDGWTAVSDDKTTLDDFERLRSVGTLDGVGAYRKLSGEVGVDGLAEVYVAPSALASRERSFFKPLLGPDAPALAVSLQPEEDGLHVQGAISPASSDLFSDEFQAELPSQVPADVLLYAGTSDLERQLGALRDMLAVAAPDLDRDIARVEAQVGVSLDEDVFPLFSGESALYVRPGFPIPEVTLVTQVDDEQGALAVVDKLAGQVVGYHGAARLRAVETGGVQAKELAVGKLFSVYYAAFDGRLVVTTSAQGIADLRSGAGRVASDNAFESATEAAGMPGETTGFIYVDLDKAVPSALALAGLGGGEIPTWLQQDLEPLHSLVLYGTREGDVARFQGLLAIH
jgi:hypothetical protein